MYPRLLPLMLLVSCSNPPVYSLGPDEVPLHVEQRCPGDPGCDAPGDNKLYGGMARRDITPKVEPFEDRNGNGAWDAGEPFEDRNGNGRFDAYWIAGFGNNRLAYGVHDPQWARALVLRRNGTTIALVAVDTLGLFREETTALEQALARTLPPGAVDLVLLHATHCHQAADLTGGWGPSIVQSGVNDDYQQTLRLALAEVVQEALLALTPVSATFSSIAVEDGPSRDLTRYVSDTRDPVIIDNVLHTIQLRSEAGAPVGTVINWAHHPESVGSDNHLLSSDFVHPLREAVEKKAGGVALYVSGALGGQIGPGRVTAQARDGKRIAKSGFDKAEAIGQSVADFALNAMAAPDASSFPSERLDLSFRSASLLAQVANSKYHLAGQLGVFRRAFCCYDKDRPIGDDNLPSIQTRVAYLQLGPAAIITNPGELLPELFIGGYDGRYSGTYPIVDSKKPNSPDLTRAPTGPYLIDLMDGARPHRMTFGLTLDFVGYIVPRYNWLLDETAPYLKDAPGDHYEETNSLGPLAEPQIVGAMRQLILDGRAPVAR